LHDYGFVQHNRGQPPPHEYTAPNWTDMKSAAINVTPAIAIIIKAWTRLFKQIQFIIVSSTIIIELDLSGQNLVTVMFLREFI
jgi:hypothetical protein